MKLPGGLLPAVFVLLCLVNLYGEYQDQKTIVYFSKPLLLTTLSLFFYLESRFLAVPFRWLLLAGLIFSIAGDTFLMFVENEKGYQHFFLLGLGSFLITHICYLLGFRSLAKNNRGWVQERKWVILFFVLYLLGNYWFLWPDLPTDLKIPVLVYSAAIIGMAAFALNLRGLIPEKAWVWLMVGVLLFVLSDSLIALNKFKSTQLSLPHPRLLIMITYLLGQYLIVGGSLRIFTAPTSHE